MADILLKKSYREFVELESSDKLIYKNLLGLLTLIRIKYVSLQRLSTFKITKMILNFNHIYSAYYRKAFLFTQSYVRNDLVAEDIVSEAIIHLWELSKKGEVESVEAILITYIRSKSLNHLKHIRAQENVFQALLDKGQRELEIRISTLEACDPEEIMSEELRLKAKSLIENMPERTRTVFILDRLDGKSHKEIADELGISVKGVEYHISKAVKILRENLKDYAPLFFFML